ncbi:MAG: endopeptidase La [bacterium]|nr:endopeptidase La [bacterium]
MQEQQPQADNAARPSIPAELGVLPLRDTVIFPFMIAPLLVGREKSIRLINDALSGDKLVGLVAQRKADTEDPRSGDLFSFGTVCRIHKMIRFPDQRVNIIIQGLQRFRLERVIQEEPYLRAAVTPLDDIVEGGKELQALTRSVSNGFQKILSLSPVPARELQMTVLNISEPSKLADFIVSNMDVDLPGKQELLEELDVRERLRKLLHTINRELEILELGTKIQSSVQSTINKGMREHYLREQLKAIQKELGEEDEQSREVREFEGRIAKARMPKEVEETARRELGRFATINPAAPEYTVSKTYLEWLVSLPWAAATEDSLDIRRAKRILDRDHYDLEKVKERILEHLAVRKIKRDTKGPILCFVGPPGVGKTSLGKSIAAAMGRRFIRISLGGVRDEAEIRGHRRTYVGALPGRVIQNIKKCGSRNPVFMIDEVDKIGVDFRGDPSSALLEVLDPEQNYSFSDHYLEVPFDLSRVMFITTANILEPVPPALRDRMEVLELPGYTEEEKVRIARGYLIPRQLREHGLTAARVRFGKDAIEGIIRDYTREAGLRNLEREIAAVCRKVAKAVAQGRTRPVAVTRASLKSFLGPVRFFPELAERTSEPGVAIGLAWTATGGEILFIEAKRMRGKKGLTLTGQLGDVMKESAMAAMSLVRSNARRLGVAEDFFDKSDVHIHVPAGAIPKDGPSAGAAIAAALVSLLRGQPLDWRVGMTGEITLTGKILPVGGVKEKVLAARRAGLRKVIIPEKNRKDLLEIPAVLRRELSFAYVRDVGQLLRHLFPGIRRGRRGRA